ncbi:MAG: hypothetical protein M3362_06980 [Acidobacteriota bacterium]|nr:hypothetical protein [Acidobacteriota bacterium]
MIKKFVSRTMIVAALVLGTTFPSLATVANTRTGTFTGSYRLAAGYQHTFSTISFKRGERASVYVEGDGYSDLDVYVYDAWGNLVAFDDAKNSDESIAEWIPTYTGVYTVVVINRGYTYNDYYFEAD